MKEFGLSVLLATVGSFFSTYLGGWDAALKLLVALMIIDYITGILSAWKEKTLSSDAMFWGGLKKGAVFLVILIGVLLDQLIGDAPLFRTLAIFYYISREGLSVTENLGKMGVPLPPALVNALAQLKDRGMKDEEKK